MKLRHGFQSSAILIAYLLRTSISWYKDESEENSFLSIKALTCILFVLIEVQYTYHSTRFRWRLMFKMANIDYISNLRWQAPENIVFVKVWLLGLENILDAIKSMCLFNLFLCINWINNQNDQWSITASMETCISQDLFKILKM